MKQLLLLAAAITLACSPVGAVTMALAYTSHSVGSLRILLESAVQLMLTSKPIAFSVDWADSARSGSS